MYLINSHIGLHEGREQYTIEQIDTFTLLPADFPADFLASASEQFMTDLRSLRKCCPFHFPVVCSHPQSPGDGILGTVTNICAQT